MFLKKHYKECEYKQATKWEKIISTHINKKEVPPQKKSQNSVTSKK